MKISRYTAAILWPYLVAEMDALGDVLTVNTSDYVSELGMLEIEPKSVSFANRGQRRLRSQQVRTVDLTHAI